MRIAGDGEMAEMAGHQRIASTRVVEKIGKFMPRIIAQRKLVPFELQSSSNFRQIFLRRSSGKDPPGFLGRSKIPPLRDAHDLMFPAPP